jgi:CubicO group peptidase (beta-lactamase class C family)
MKAFNLFIIVFLVFTLNNKNTLGQNQKIPREKLQKILNESIDNKSVFGAVVQVAYRKDAWIGSAGNLVNKNQYFIASISKLFITTIIFQLRAEGRLQLNDPIANYLPEIVWKELHIFKGVDYSREITIEQLLAHTSGLPDYLQGKKQNGSSLLNDLTSGADQSWTFEEAIALSKTMQPQFKPGTPKKALYSDTNYQLLGKIIENILGNKLQNVLDERIFKPLGLAKTYLYLNPQDHNPVDLYYDSSPLKIPKAMASFWADGGIVSNAEESFIFLKAFMNGTLFPKEDLAIIQKEWNAIFFPLQYGIGIMKFQLPRIFSPFKAMPVLIGHSGLSGSFSFYCQEKDVFLCGTINQIKNPSQSYKLMLKLLQNIE